MLACCGPSTVGPVSDNPRDQVIGPVGIASAEQVGTPTVSQDVAPKSANSGGQTGTPAIGQVIAPAGIGPGSPKGEPAALPVGLAEEHDEALAPGGRRASESAPGELDPPITARAPGQLRGLAEVAPFSTAGVGQVTFTTADPELPSEPSRDPRSEPAPMPAPPVKTVSVAMSRSQSRSGPVTVHVEPPQARSEGASDAPTADDRLGFAPYVTAVAEFLLNPATTTPFAMSIEGAWGAGKSSFLAQVAAALTHMNPPWMSGVRLRVSRSEATNRGPRLSARVVTFNPWRHETDQSLWASFALEFVEQCKPGLVRRPYSALRYWSRRFDFNEGWRPVALFLTACVAVLAAPLLPRVTEFAEWLVPATLLAAVKAWKFQAMSVGGAATLMITAMRAHRASLDVKLKEYFQRPDYAAKVSFLTSFREDFEAYVSTHLGKNERVFVLVDDLDRCEPLHAAQLLKAINLMVPDTLPIVFLVAIDRRKVAAGIAVAHEKSMPFVVDERDPSGKLDHDAAVSYGYDFLEKFFQLPFRLPRTGPNSFRPFVESLTGAALRRPGGAPRQNSAAVKRTSRPLQDVASDNAEVGEIVLELAPLLGFSPRRAKQFLNLFRLRHYVLQSLSLLGSAGAPSLRQLGRIVALEIAWPRFVETALQRPDVLGELERAAAEKQLPTRDARPDLWPWIGRDQLVAFLRGASSEDRIGGLDLGELLGASVTPRATTVLSPPTAEQKQDATVLATIRRADGSSEDVDLTS